MEAEAPPLLREQNHAAAPDAGAGGAWIRTVKPHGRQTTDRPIRPVQLMGSSQDARAPNVRARPNRRPRRSSVSGCRRHRSAVLRRRWCRPRQLPARARALPARPDAQRARGDDARASAGRPPAEAERPSTAASRTSDQDAALRSPAGFLLKKARAPLLPAVAYGTRTESGDATPSSDPTRARAGSTSRNRACRARSSGTAQRATFATFVSGRARVSSSWPSASVPCGQAEPCGLASSGCATALVWERPGLDA
jgi:hypothetical protein